MCKFNSYSFKNYVYIIIIKNNNFNNINFLNKE